MIEGIPQVARERSAALSTSPGSRLAPLDGMRGLAILLVVLFHFFQRFPEYYPYGNDILPLASRGYLGVHLFFIISGFVIALTLSKKPTLLQFAVGRFVRLWPAMLVCSTLTFIILNSGQTDFALARRVDWTGFLPSLTFTAPSVWQPLVGETSWIDGAYWSLFVEVRFYFWAALACAIFGVKRLHDAIWSMMVLTHAGLVIVDQFQPEGIISKAWEMLFFTEYMPLFCIGLACYEIYMGRRGLFVIAALTTSIFFSFFMSKDFHQVIFLAFSSAWFVYYAKVKEGRLIDIFGSKILTFFGAISYSLYLLHQNIGVYIISLFPKGLDQTAYLAMVCILIGLVSLLAYAVFRWIEKPFNALGRRFRLRQTFARRRVVAQK